MNDLLGILKTYEIWIYAFLGVVCLIYIRKVILAVMEWQRAVFGIEKEKAQRKLSEATSVIIFLFIVAAGWFLIVSFVSPIIPNSIAMSTPTLDLLATQTVTLSADQMSASGNTLSSTLVVTPTSEVSGCIPGEIEFTFPEAGSEISGKVTLKGTVNVTDFGFYKYEYSTPGSLVWNTISADVNLVTTDSDLGIWDTSQLNVGDYQLRLVVTDHNGNELTPCVIQVRIVAP